MVQLQRKSFYNFLLDKLEINHQHIKYKYRVSIGITFQEICVFSAVEYIVLFCFDFNNC